MKKNLSLYIFLPILTAGLFSACSSERVVPGNVFSNENYEMMGKQVTFAEYGFSALDKRTKRTVERQRLKFLNAVDEYFMHDLDSTDGVLNIYNKKR